MNVVSSNILRGNNLHWRIRWEEEEPTHRILLPLLVHIQLVSVQLYVAAMIVVHGFLKFASYISGARQLNE